MNGRADSIARIQKGGVTADITGNWTVEGDTIEVTNTAGASPARIAVIGGETHAGEVASSRVAWDRTKPEPGSVHGRDLTNDGSGLLRLKAGERRKSVIEFKPFSEKNKPVHEDEVSIAVPMPDAPSSVRFRYGGQ